MNMTEITSASPLKYDYKVIQGRFDEIENKINELAVNGYIIDQITNSKNHHDVTIFTIFMRHPLKTNQ